MKFITVLFLIFISNVPFCQNKESLKKYYTNIQEAQSDLLQNQNFSAHKKYKRAFDFLQNPFANDLHNALRNSTKISSDNEYIRTCLERLQYKGFSKDTLITLYPEYRELISTIDFNKPNSELADILADIKSKDQSIRRYCKEYCYPEYRTCNSCLDTINYVDSLKAIVLLNILQEQNISEEDISNPDQFVTIFLIIQHNSGREVCSLMLEKLREQVGKGKFDSRVYADLFDTHHKKNENYEQGTESIYGSDMYIASFNMLVGFIPDRKSALKTIDKNRSKIYLNTLEQAIHQKALFLNNPTFFEYHMRVALHDLPESVESSLIKDAKKDKNDVLYLFPL